MNSAPENTRWFPHTTVATVVENKGQYLMVEEAPNGQVVFNQPAGHLEANETLLEAAYRETLEETGWEVQLEHLIGVYVLRLPDKVYHRYCFAAQALRHCPQRPLDPDIRAAHWMTMEEILLAEQSGALRSELVMRCLVDFQRGRRFPLDLIFDDK